MANCVNTRQPTATNMSGENLMLDYFQHFSARGDILIN